MRRIVVVTIGFCLAAGQPARAQDARLCFSTAELAKMGTMLSDADKKQGHEACLRALTESSNIVQKYHLQEADFDIMGTRPKP